jgi:hypothetical protein
MVVEGQSESRPTRFPSCITPAEVPRQPEIRRQPELTLRSEGAAPLLRPAPRTWSLIPGPIYTNSHRRGSAGRHRGDVGLGGVATQTIPFETRALSCFQVKVGR